MVGWVGLTTIVAVVWLPGSHLMAAQVPPTERVVGPPWQTGFTVARTGTKEAPSKTFNTKSRVAVAATASVTRTLNE